MTTRHMSCFSPKIWWCSIRVFPHLFVSEFIEFVNKELQSKEFDPRISSIKRQYTTHHLHYSVSLTSESVTVSGESGHYSGRKFVIRGNLSKIRNSEFIEFFNSKVEKLDCPHTVVDQLDRWFLYRKSCRHAELTCNILYIQTHLSDLCDKFPQHSSFNGT